VSPKPRVVFDNNVLVSALLFEESVPGKAFYAAFNQCIVLESSDSFFELCGVLARPKFDPYVARDDRERFLVKLLVQSELVEVKSSIQVCRDPKDNKFLELAIAATADCIVSGDQDLLVLNPFRELPILTPSDFLSWLASRSSSVA